MFSSQGKNKFELASSVLFGESGARKIALNYALFAGVWSPIIVAFWIFVFEPSNFWGSFCISLVIAETTLAFCYLGGHLLSALVRAYRVHLGQVITRSPVMIEVLKSSVFMLPGMYFGFILASHLAAALHLPWEEPDLGSYKRGILIGIINVVLALALYLKYETKVLKRRVETDKKDYEMQTLKAQIAALTAQMNPHLLFNTLNSIASHIQTQPDEAEEMTLKLSALYRLVLEASKKERQTLHEELEICRNYLEIEQGRFRDRISYTIEIDGGVDVASTHIPVLCLQPLVENAVKHGILPLIAGGNVAIKIRQDQAFLGISIEDNGVGLENTANKGSGTAVENCRSRLKLAYGDGAQLTLEPAEVSGTKVLVKIPKFKERG